MFLDQDHPLMTKQNDIQSLCADFFKSNPFHYFTLVRCYRDGSFFPLGTHAQFVLDWFDMLPMIATSQKCDLYTQRYTFLWDEVLPKEGLHIATCKHHLYHGITLLYRYKDYFDTVSFAMEKDMPSPGSYYVSSLKLLEDFYEDTLKRGREIIRIFEKEKIILPPEKQDKNAHTLFLGDIKGKIQLPFDGAYLTSREMMCLHMLDKGKSYKYISNIFDVSPRTIETYISRAKKRTDISNLNDLLKMLRMATFNEPSWQKI